MATKTRVSKLKNNAIYDAKNTKRYGLKFNYNTDADIIDALDNAPSKQGLVKEAIRFYLANNTRYKKD